MNKEIYEYCKKCLDQFYDENLDIIKYLINNGNKEYLNIKLENNLINYESKNEGNNNIKCYIKFTLDEEKYVIYVDNSVATRIVLGDEFVLSNQKYSQSIEKYKNMLYAISNTLNKCKLTIDKELITK
ncbi:MAG: hypothetical protein SPK63_01975 [Eubacteriales bacterium]|nr:hypothetical protein [Eubacteriales bacterium]